MPKGKTYEILRADIESIPVIDTHEHFTGPDSQEGHKEPIKSVTSGYVHSDIMSADGERTGEILQNGEMPTEEKWPVFERVWRKMQHTGYARVTKLILANEYGVDEISLEAFKSISGRLLDLRDPAAFEAMMDRYGIRCSLINVWIDWKKFLAGAVNVRHAKELEQATHQAETYLARCFWDSPWLYAAILLLLAGEWFARRRVGLP